MGGIVITCPIGLIMGVIIGYDKGGYGGIILGALLGIPIGFGLGSIIGIIGGTIASATKRFVVENIIEDQKGLYMLLFYAAIILVIFIISSLWGVGKY